MKCTLCDRPIENYQPAFHHLTIDEAHAVDICPACLDKIVKWQQGIYTTLFPTTAMKKRFGKR